MLLHSLPKKPAVIAIVEVKYKNSRTFELAELNLNGYVLYSNKFDVNSRGVIIYVDSQLESKLISLDDSYKESVFIKVKANKTSWTTIGCIYRSPNSNPENDNKLFELIDINSRNCKNENLLITGDFNFNDINWETWSSAYTSGDKFLDSLRNNFLYQHVNYPTRARGTDTPHILDLVLTNEPFINNVEYFSPLGKSDHSVLLITTTLLNCIKTNRVRKNFNKGDYDGLRNFLTVDWDRTLSREGTD
ncbi:MAG: endonuclease/exonuclease/phosphatase family protein, partial [Oscillospiraceae bacterium]